jgi:hypothetical protein
MEIESGRSVNSNNREGMEKKGPMSIPNKKEEAKKNTKKSTEPPNPNVRVIKTITLGIGCHMLHVLLTRLYEQNRTFHWVRKWGDWRLQNIF